MLSRICLVLTQERDFVVLCDYDHTTYRISDVSLGISNDVREEISRSTEVGCHNDQLVLVYQHHLGENISIIVEFKVSGLIMGPKAGRANLFLDEVQVASCVHEICTASIPLERYQECRSLPSLESSCLNSHELSIRLFAMEPTLQYEERFFLGVSRTFSFFTAATSAGGGGSAVRVIRADDRVSPDLCMSGETRGSEQMHAAARSGDADAGPASGAAEQQEGVEEPERVAEEGESSSAQQAFMQHLVRANPHITEVRAARCCCRPPFAARTRSRPPTLARPRVRGGGCGCVGTPH
jgi:hypothetical protein